MLDAIRKKNRALGLPESSDIASPNFDVYANDTRYISRSVVLKHATTAPDESYVKSMDKNNLMYTFGAPVRDPLWEHSSYEVVDRPKVRHESAKRSNPPTELLSHPITPNPAEIRHGRHELARFRVVHVRRRRRWLAKVPQNYPSLLQTKRINERKAAV